MQFSALARPVSDTVDMRAGVVEEFRSDEGNSASTNIPSVKAALVALFNAWPTAISFQDLSDVVSRGSCETAPAETPEGLADSLVQCYLSNVVAMHVSPPRFANLPGERPRANPLARCQCSLGQPVANLRHRLVQLNDVDRLVLNKLDGSADRATILSELTEAVRDATKPVDTHDGKWLEESLRRLAYGALLEQ